MTNLFESVKTKLNESEYSFDDIDVIVHDTGAEVVWEDIKALEKSDELLDMINNKQWKNDGEVISYIETSDEVDALRNTDLNESEKIHKVDAEELGKLVDKWTENKDIPYDRWIGEENGRFVAIDNRSGDCWTEEFPNKEDAMAWLTDEFEMGDYAENGFKRPEAEKQNSIEDAVRSVAEDFGVNFDYKIPFEYFYAPEEDEYNDDYDYTRFYHNILARLDDSYGYNDDLLKGEAKVSYVSDGKQEMDFGSGDVVDLRAWDGFDDVVTNVKDICAILNLGSQEPTNESQAIKESAGYYNWKKDIKDVEPTEENDDIWYAVAENMAEKGDEGTDDPLEIMSNIINLFKISKGSKLYKYLLKWYKSEDELLNKVRDVYNTNDAIYFVTGTGYSIFDADLLGGNADGLTEREFDKFVQEQEESDPEVSDDNEEVRLVYGGKIYYEFDRDEWYSLDPEEQETYILDTADQASEEEGYPVDADEVDVEED